MAAYLNSDKLGGNLLDSSEMEGDGDGRKRSDWNIYLLENVVAPSYGRLLEKVALEIGQQQ